MASRFGGAIKKFRKQLVANELGSSPPLPRQRVAWFVPVD
jgi:hypothetical protein